MFAWRGLGFLVPLIFATAVLLVYWPASVITGDPDFYMNNVWTQLCSSIISSVCIYFLGRRLNRKVVQKYIDEETGEEREEVIEQNKHSFFFVRFEYWAFIVPVLNVLEIFVL